MNTESGAALCFTCGWRGNLARLVGDLEADLDLEDFEFVALVRRADRLTPAAGGDAEEAVDPYVSEYAFTKHSYPPPDELCIRHLTMAEAVRLNLRWDVPRRYWLIPVYDFDGTPAGLAGEGARALQQRAAADAQAALPVRARPGRRPTVFVVESPLDVGRFLRHGYAAVATYGASASSDQLGRIARMFSRIVLAYDNDRAGWDATASMADQLRTVYGRPVSYYRYPPNSYGEDPGSLSGVQFRHAASTTLAVPPEIMRSLQEL